MPPLLSVIMATRNRAGMLPQSVKSVLDQTFSNFELIIVDDYSSDNTPSILAEMCSKDPRIKAVHLKENVGPGKARNLGIDRSSGSFIAIFDDDDFCVPDRFETQISILQKHPQMGLTFSSVGWTDESGQTIRIFPGIVKNDLFPNSNTEIFKLLYLESAKVPNITIMARREVFERVRYPDWPWIGEDWLLTMKAAALGFGMKAVSKPLVLQNRSNSHPHMMKSKATAFRAQRQVLKQIRKWLIENHITTFNSLHRLAYSNQRLREAAYWGGFKGLGLCLLAVAILPSSNRSWHMLSKSLKRIPRRIRRS